MLHDEAPFALDGFILLLSLAVVPVSRHGLLIDIDRLKDDDFIHSLLDGQLVVNIALEEPNEGVAVTIQEVAFYYEIRKTIFAIEAEAGQVFFLVFDLKGLALYGHCILFLLEFEVEVIDGFSFPNRFEE
jgi:hypothetical protein